MRILLVGHPKSISRARRMILQEYRDMEIETLYFDPSCQEKTLEFLLAREHAFDGVLFTGKVPYKLFLESMTPTVPWQYISRDERQFLGALLCASFTHHYDIHRISLDSFSEKEALDIFRKIDISARELAIRTFHGQPSARDYASQCFLFHKDNLASWHAGVAITGISPVYLMLQDAGIPSVLMQFGLPSTIDAINRLKLHCLQTSGAECDMVLIIRLRKRYESMTPVEGDLRHITTKMDYGMRISEFASRINAAILNFSMDEYVLAARTDRRPDDIYPLLSQLLNSEDTLYTLHVGAGLGKHIRSAKNGADFSISRALMEPGNAAFIACDDGTVLGPLHGSSNHPLAGQGGHLLEAGDPLLVISRESGVGTHILLSIEQSLQWEKRACMTARQLSGCLQLPLRSTHRIIRKLLDAGYAEIAGKESGQAAGRPGTIYRFRFNRE